MSVKPKTKASTRDRRPSPEARLEPGAVIREAMREYHAGEVDRLGRHDAIRGLMARLGLYGAFVEALGEASSPGEPCPAPPVTPGPYEGRVAKGMPTSCCDYGVVSLSAGRELCRTWTEGDARAIAASMNATATPVEGETRDSRIEDAVQAMSETHRSWESRCHAIMAAIGADFGRMDEFVPDEDPVDPAGDASV